MISNISPIDGRYGRRVQKLSQYFSEFALIKYRIKIEIEYFIWLSRIGVKNFSPLKDDSLVVLRNIYNNFTKDDAEEIKRIERKTNHDVKAVEYFIKNRIRKLDYSTNINRCIEYVHFGLTSQDINNTAFPLMIKNALDEVFIPMYDNLLSSMQQLKNECDEISMLAHTHGQPASPTTLSKEINVFIERLNIQITKLKEYEMKAKFGGATGNFNAHKLTFPGVSWPTLATHFLFKKFKLVRLETTTQIDHYDHLAELFHIMSRINTILIDYARDIWTYISMDYFKQKVVAGEIGSSAMPHKVNPIDFENAEGNFGMANAIFQFLASKLPVSRLQRDLTDSTVLRNVGVPFAHTMIAITSIIKGNNKLIVNREKISQDLEDNWAVIAEAIQSILRRELYPKPYEALKELTRGKSKLTKDDFQTFIMGLDIDLSVKSELLTITPENYIGYA